MPSKNSHPIKEQASRLRLFLADLKAPISHAQSLQAMSRAVYNRSWEVVSATEPPDDPLRVTKCLLDAVDSVADRASSLRAFEAGRILLSRKLLEDFLNTGSTEGCEDTEVFDAKIAADLRAVVFSDVAENILLPALSALEHIEQKAELDHEGNRILTAADTKVVLSALVGLRQIMGVEPKPARRAEKASELAKKHKPGGRNQRTAKSCALTGFLWFLRVITDHKLRGRVKFTEDSDPGNLYGLSFSGTDEAGNAAAEAIDLLIEKDEFDTRSFADDVTMAGYGEFFTFEINLDAFESEYIEPLRASLRAMNVLVDI